MIAAGKEAVQERLVDLKAQYPVIEKAQYNLPLEKYKELEHIQSRGVVLHVALEMLLRGFTVKTVDPERSDAEKFLILDNFLLTPRSVRWKFNNYVIE